MSYHSQFSIWNGESSMDSWYRNSITSKQEAKTVPINMLYASEATFNRESITLPSASFYDETYAMNGTIDHEDFTTCNKHDFRLSPEKELPSTPKTKGPYFDYMFSDVEDGDQNDEEVHHANANSNLTHSLDLMSASPREPSFLFEDAASPPEHQPSTPTILVYDASYDGFDGTTIKRETLYSLTFQSHHVIDNASPSADNTNVAGNFAINPSHGAYDTEMADATTGFYGGYDVEESPSPYHAPNIGEGSGFGDIRDGCETFLEQWTDYETQMEVVTPYKPTASPILYTEYELLAPKPLKPLRQPKSQIAKAARTCDMGFSYTHHASYTPRLTSLSGYSDDVVAQINGTRRPARDTVLSTSTENLDDAQHDHKDEDEEPQSAKKARSLSHTSMDDDAVYAPMPSTFSLFPDLKRKSSTFSISNSTFRHTGAFAPTIDGYPGQFRSLVPPSMVFNPKSFSSGLLDKATFGNKSHANGLFHHTHFQPGDNTPWNEYSLDFSQSAIPSITGPVGKALELADENLVVAGNTERTAEQENLRRETHFECSLARLEGVSVGEYRYWQGHSSIDEYNKGGMCICWEECFCSKMCGRYADMLCPCKQYIEFEG